MIQKIAPIHNAQTPRRQAISNLVVTLIIVGVGAGMAFAALGGIQDNLGSMTGSNKVVITSLNAYTAGDRMVISGNIQNIGSQPLTSITIDEITAGDLVITQLGTISDGQIATGHGGLQLSGLANNGDVITTKPITTNKTYDNSPTKVTTIFGWVNDTGIENIRVLNDVYRLKISGGAGQHDAVATVNLQGFSVVGDPDASPPTPPKLAGLAAGASQSFRIVIGGDSTSTEPAILDILRTVPASTQLFMTIAGTDGQTSTISDPRSVRVTAR